MADVRLGLRYDWRPLDPATTDGERITFPSIEEVPGIYRFDLPGRIYIGEASRLRRRFQHYRTPGPTQTTNLRLREIIQNALAGGHGVSVAVVTSAFVRLDGDDERPLDLSLRPARLLVENAALMRAFLEGQKVENL